MLTAIKNSSAVKRTRKEFKDYWLSFTSGEFVRITLALEEYASMDKTKLIGEMVKSYGSPVGI